MDPKTDEYGNFVSDECDSNNHYSCFSIRCYCKCHLKNSERLNGVSANDDSFPDLSKMTYSGLKRDQ